MGRDGRHDRPAVDWVHELQGVTQMRIDLGAALSHGVQGRTPLGVGVVEQRLMRRAAIRRVAFQRTHVAAIAVQAIAGRGLFRELVLGIALSEAGVEVTDGRDVQPVQPDHRRLGRVAVVVPLAARRQHQVEGLHHRLLAVHRGIGAAALHDEAQGALGMAVSGRDLARQDQLQTGVEAGRDRRQTRQAGVFEDQHPALGLLGADQIARPHQVFAGLVIGPLVHLGG
ncbi:hypothetical protein D3C72_1338340 [compost metagenome]